METITNLKQAFAKIEEIKNDESYEKLKYKTIERHKNLLSQTGTEEKEQSLRKEINKLRDAIYPKLRKLPYNFVVIYYNETGDAEFFRHYINAIVGSSINTAMIFLSQPINLYLGLYSFKGRELLPSNIFRENYKFKDRQIIENNFKEFKIFASPKTKYRSLLEMLSEQKTSLINSFEKDDTGEAIIGKVISSYRQDVPEELKGKFKYFRLKKEKELKEQWNKIYKKWQVIENNDDEEKLKEFNAELEAYIKELEQDEEFVNLLKTFKSQFGLILTEEYIKQKTGESNYYEGLKYYFWTFYFGTIRMILIDQDINNIYFLPIITGKKDKYIGGAVVLNSQYRLADKHPINSKEQKIANDELLRNYQLIFSGYVDDYQMQELDMIAMQSRAEEIAVSVVANNISHNLGSHALSYIKNDLPEKNNDLKYLKKAANFIGYLQERQEFISMFTMQTKPFYSPINFKHFIEERFTNKNLLLEYIAQSEGFREDNIKINFKYKNVDEKAFEVQLPGGHLGSQAFFSILEQMIRNIAKHQKILDNEIKIGITITDQGSDDYYEVEIKDETGISNDHDISKIKSALTSEFMRYPDKAKEMGKGMQEIFIMSAWLRGVTPAELVLGKYDDKEIVEASLDNDNHLILKLKISKPKKLLIITDKDKSASLKAPDYTKIIDYKELREPQSYFLNVIDSSVVKKIGDISKFLTFRQIECDLREGVKNFEYYYQQWLKKYLGEDADNKKILICSITLVIYTIESNSSGIAITQIQDLNDIDREQANIILMKYEKCPKNPNELVKSADIIYYKHFYESLSAKEDKTEKIINYHNVIGTKFIESLSGGDFTESFIELPKNKEWYYKAVESGLTSVLIFDECIYSQKKKDSLNYYKYRNLNVCIVTIEERDNGLKILDMQDKIVGSIDEKGNINMSDLKYFKIVSIHQGLLDRIFDYIKNNSAGKEDLDKKEIMKRVIDSIKEFKNIFRVVIHSGRSILPQLPSGVAFVSYTALENALNASKYNLTEQLFSTNLK